jgi:hypothetical protein
VKPGGGKEWFTAAELADLALAGLGGVKRRINERAASEGWALRTGKWDEPLARPRTARGGGLEYHISVLPAAARVALAAMGIAVVADIVDPPASAALTGAALTGAAQLWRWFDGASDKVKTEAARRMTAIGEIETYEAAGLTRSAAVATVAAMSAIGASTLWSWLGLIEGVAASDRLAYLAPRRAGGGASAEVEASCWQVLLSDYLRPEKPTFTECYRRMVRDYAAPRGIAVPIERTLRRKLERVDGRLIIARREGAEALRRSIPAQERSVMELHALEAVNIDGHKFDVFVRWEDGRIGRPMMVALQDIYSRKIVAHRIDESENALVTRLTFADLFRDYGIPKHCLLDNGRAFASKLITGGAKSRFRFKIKAEEPTGILTALGIHIHWATPYRGQSKPIERAFRDLCDTIAKHPALAGAYTGNRPDAKPENYGSKAIPIADFRAVCAAGIAAHNARPGRRTETAQGRSFDDVFAASYAVAPIGKATPEQLRLALLTAEERTCDRDTGVVTLEGNRYHAAELRDHTGKRVTLRFDPDDLHGAVHVYDRAGMFICTAPAIGRDGFFDKASAGKRKAQEADLRRTVREVERLTDLIDVQSLAALMPAHPDETPAPIAAVVRPVRHRGQTRAALKPVSEASQALLDAAQGRPLAPVIDRLAGLRLVG